MPALTKHTPSRHAAFALAAYNNEAEQGRTGAERAELNATLVAAQRAATEAARLYLHTRDTLTAQQYAIAVLNTIHLTAINDEWSHPRMWTTGEVQMAEWDGARWPYVEIHNDGPRSIKGYQGNATEWIAVRNSDIGQIEP